MCFPQERHWTNHLTVHQTTTSNHTKQAILLTPSKAGLPPLARVAALETLTLALQIKVRTRHCFVVVMMLCQCCHIGR